MIVPHSDQAWMQQALACAQQAQAWGEVPVGAVVLYQGRVIARGYNRSIVDKDPTAHAEILALRAAAQVLGNHRLPGCELFSTLEPCAMCAGALLHARIARLVFGALDPKTGAAGSAINILTNTALNHQTQVKAGVLAEECGQILRDFFKTRR